LRNVFAHGQWKYNEAKVNPDNMTLRVTDYKSDNSCKSGSDCRTFVADIEIGFLLEISEKLLLVAFQSLQRKSTALQRKGSML